MPAQVCACDCISSEGASIGSDSAAAYTVPFPNRPTKILIEPAVCKSLKILEVASRALASLLITESGIWGNRAENRAAAEATLATSLRFSMGERAKKSQPIRVGILSIGGGIRNRTCVRFPKRIAIDAVFVTSFGRLSFFPLERYLTRELALLYRCIYNVETFKRGHHGSRNS